MYDLIKKDIEDLNRELLEKPGLTKKRKKRDIKIIQEVKITQAMLKKAMPQHSGDSQNINIINMQISNVNELTETQQESNAEKVLSGPVIEAEKPIIIPDKLKNHEELYHCVEMIIKYLPKPRKTNLIRIMYEIAYENFDTTVEMAEWLGVERSSVYHWFRKMGVLPPDTAKKLEANKHEWREVCPPIKTGIKKA